MKALGNWVEKRSLWRWSKFLTSSFFSEQRRYTQRRYITQRLYRLRQTPRSSSNTQLFRTILEEIMAQSSANPKQQGRGDPLGVEGLVEVLRGAVHLLR